MAECDSIAHGIIYNTLPVFFTLITTIVGLLVWKCCPQAIPYIRRVSSRILNTTPNSVPTVVTTEEPII